MEISYWQSRWEKNNTGWHMPQVYPLLIKYWHRLNLDRRSTVLVPMCGKSLDMHWLAAQGHQVIGVEVSEIAVREFIKESGQVFETSSTGSFTVYTSASIQLWLGDVFKLHSARLPPLDAIYDKAALIALPKARRVSYADLIQQLCSSRTQVFLNTLEYEQSEMSGPPFSVQEAELQALYGAAFDIHLLHEHSLLEQLPKFKQRGLSAYLLEKIYHFLPK